MFLVGVAEGEVLDEELLVEGSVVECGEVNGVVVDLAVVVGFGVLVAVEVLILTVVTPDEEVVDGARVLVETTADLTVLVVVLQVALIFLAEHDAVPG